MWRDSVCLQLFIPPYIHPRRIVCLRVCILILFGWGLTLLVFTASIFGFTWGGFVGACDVLMLVLIHGERLGAISGLIFFTLGAGIILHRIISLFSEKTLTICCKASCLLSPIYLIGVDYVGFSQNFPIPTDFVMTSVVKIKGILVDYGKIDRVSWSPRPRLWGIYLVRTISIHERPNAKPGYYMKCPWPTFSWFLMYNYFHPGGTIVVLLK